MKAKATQTPKKLAARKQTGKVHMPLTATGLTSQAGFIYTGYKILAANWL